MKHPLDEALTDILIHAAILDKCQVPDIEVALVGGTSIYDIEDEIEWFPFLKITKKWNARMPRPQWEHSYMVRPQWEHSYFDIPEPEYIDVSIRKFRELEIDPILLEHVRHFIKYHFQHDYRGGILRILELKRGMIFYGGYQVK